MRADLRIAGFGIALGFVLSWLGFADYDEVVAMFSLERFRLWIAFAIAVGVAAIGLRWDRRSAPPRAMHPGIVPGAIVFGIGWAITGACPGSAFVQLGEGQLPAAFTVLGIVLGALGYGAVHRRFFRWDPGSCAT
jgi:uncharacterized protein